MLMITIPNESDLLEFTPQDNITPLEAAWIAAFFSWLEHRNDTARTADSYVKWELIARHFQRLTRDKMDASSVEGSLAKTDTPITSAKKLEEWKTLIEKSEPDENGDYSISALRNLAEEFQRVLDEVERLRVVLVEIRGAVSSNFVNMQMSSAAAYQFDMLLNEAQKGQ